MIESFNETTYEKVLCGFIYVLFMYLAIFINLIVTTKRNISSRVQPFDVVMTKENDSRMRVKSALISCEETDFQSHVLGMRQSIESKLANILSEFSDIELRPLLEYALLSKGKRLRSILTVLSAQSVGGNPEKVMPLALSFELLHTATLVHDDIIDQDTARRGTKTLCTKWSANNAILAGDALIALSINLAADFGPEIMKILSNVGLELCDGEYLDANLCLEKATEQQYFAKIEKKSASLFRGAACCGALAVEGKPLEVEALAKFGEYFGMAYQLNDDLEDLLGKNQISQDLKNGNVTLPLLRMYKRGDGVAKNLLKENFGNRNVSVAVAKEIRDTMDEIGAFVYCRRRIADYSKKAKASLNDIRDSMFKSHLLQFSNHVDESEG